MRAWILMMAAATLAGCAASNANKVHTADERPDSAVAAAKPVDTAPAVKLVAHRPPAKRYKYVGRVEAAANTADFVEAARTTNDLLRRKAKALGADVVQVDVISAGRHVLLAGRCYKKVSG
jgi:hypothetical protein